MSPCSPTATEQWGATSTYIFATHVKLSFTVLSTLPTPPKPTTLPMIDACKTRGKSSNKGWWASTGLGEAPRSRYQGGFAPPTPPGIVVFI